jgi:hypothetical protein
MRSCWLLILIGCSGPAITLDPSQARAEGVDTLRVYVDGATDPVFGEASREGNALVFRPRFPFRPGVPYRVVAGDVERTITLPAPERPRTSLTRVYPTRDVLPENQLKFYLHFSGPMSKGEIYRRVSLYEGSRKVELPFLELGEELWDRENRRVTLLFDPGRIKNGLVPREEEGPALEKGKTYTLVVDGAWPDAWGRPLTKAFRKTFRVAEPDLSQPDPKAWSWRMPKAGTVEPLELTFPEPLDAGLLARVLGVEGVEGDVHLDREETVWRFTPKAPWKAGAHALVVDTILEDLAGNSLERKFEVDIVRPTQPRLETKTLRLPFKVLTN